ncbi:MAG: hypothetical protein A2589_00140 [Candidatus Vogelbacteria bacterium RIFOXYD1_FULL_46_19]|uniref:Peptidase C39 domain-containing protein n=1 Tax=Candidatus Vogelbacteria bacterium RIFOXYD1_FULL_46_19 TaxID=1802439 RepID=A0A1G2QHP1_9BACT|nr:MAG: hypothetical protein A2589_00140 [Candidatus Vogelbacteria bacterium RIFOXYD1_FULL_46_19]
MTVLQTPYYKQDKVYTCAAAALQSVLGHWGCHKSEAWLERKLKTDPRHGVSHRRLEGVSRQLGFACTFAGRGSLALIGYYLKKGSPVMVNYIEPATNQGHYAVVVGLSETEVILNDPWLGERFKLKQNEFMRRWHNGRKNSKHWMLVLRRK